MTDSELDRKLSAASVPERSPEYWETFSGRVMARVRATPATRALPRLWQPRLAWGTGMALTCLLLVLAIGHWHGDSNSDVSASLQNGKTLREILTFFPNRVRAITQDEHGVQLILSDAPDVPVSTPLWIQLYDGKNSRSMVTFSGQELQIAKEKVQVLADAQGRVILVGDRFVWSSAEPNRLADGLRIQAYSLQDVM